MAKQLPTNPNLEYDKKQAKRLLKAFHDGDDDAVQRVHQHLPHVQHQPLDMTRKFPLTLMQAQTVIAREYDMKSWGDLRLAIKLKNNDYGDKLNTFKQVIYQHDASTLDTLLTENSDLRDTINDPHFAFGSTAVIISKHHLDVVDVLLKHGADINAKSQWWAGDFHVMEIVSPDLAEKLMKRGAEITVHAAAEQGWLDWLEKAYTENPEIIHERGGDGKTPLHYATDPKIMDWLLERGADIDARDFDHMGTPLQWMIAQKKWESAKALGDRGATVDIYAAIISGDLDLVKQTVKDYPSAIHARIDQPGYPLVPQADGFHQYSYIFSSGRSPHQVALQFDQREIYTWLIENSPPEVQLLAYCADANAEKAKALLNTHPNLINTIQPSDHQQLVHSAWNHETDAINLMLELGFDPHITDAEKLTPLHRASFHGFADIVKILLDADDNPPLDKLNAYDGTPLTTCLYGAKHSWRDDGDFEETLKLLVSAGSNVKAEWLPTDNPAFDDILREGIK